MNSVRVAIEGTVGAGKTTLCNIMKSEFNLDLVSEEFENPYFEDFYKEPSIYAYPMHVQIFRQQFDLMFKSRNLDRVITDRTLEASLIFMKLLSLQGTVTNLDYKNYVRMVYSFSPLCPAPDLVIYLRVSDESSINRILKRNRSAELEASLKYWKDLNREYNSWFESYSSPKVVIDTDQIDITDSKFDIRSYLTEVADSTPDMVVKDQLSRILN